MKFSAPRLIGSVPFVCVGLLLLIASLYQIHSPHGWLIVIAYWPVYLVGLIAVVVSVLKYRNWWVLLTLPILALPLILGGALLDECSRGNCL
jgi:hypothetical protein